MNINAVTSPMEGLSLDLTQSPKIAANPTKDLFAETLTAAMGMFDVTNDLQKTADVAQIDFATGKNDNMLSVLMAEQKALTSLDFTVQVTNKVIEAYREIMRIQL